jgi:flavin-dependent dehydrogenase
MGILNDVAHNACPVYGYEVVAPNGRATRAGLPKDSGALVIPRLQLDEIILRTALRSGARFEPRVNVSRVEPLPAGARAVTADGHSFEARVAVIASGAAFGVLTRSGILRQTPTAMLAGRAYFEDLQSDVARMFQLRFDDAPLPGYGWVFPVGAHAANVGVGFLPRRKSVTAHHALDRFIGGAGLKTMLRGARQTGPMKGYPIRVDFLRSPTYAENTLLVGEAAGLVNPLTGEGIDYALECGKLAAEHVAAALDQDGFTPAAMHGYDRALRTRFERIFRFSEQVRDWYCKPPLLNMLVPLANARPELRQLLSSIVLGEREPRGYGPATMLARLLVYLVRTRTRSAMP